MTGLLTDLMHDRADELDAPSIDLLAIAREGERRVRRRRTALVGGVAAASVAAVLTGAAVLGRTPADTVVADGSASSPQALAWVTGSTLHRVDGSSVDLGTHVRAWVWVGDAIAFTDDRHQVWLWTDGTSQTIGRTATPEADDPELVSDGTFVAWVGDDGRAVRYDTGTATLVRAPVLPGSAARVTAVDGAMVYVADSAGAYSWQPSGPEGYRTLGGPDDVVLDAESGTVVSQGPQSTLRITRAGSTSETKVDDFADLSPDGRTLAVEAGDTGLLLDADTVAPEPFDHGHEWAVGYDWLDATTVAVLAFDQLDTAGEQATLLTCDTASATCDPDGVAVDGEIGTFQLPIGVHFAP